MALKKKTQTGFGLEVLNAYCRVEGVRIIAKDRLQFQVRASVDGQMPHFSDNQHECGYDLNGANPIKQAYEHLKTLPEFAGATDC
jgi:hypothetical protein